MKVISVKQAENYHVYVYKGKNAAKESTWDYFLKEPPLIDLLTNNT